MQWLGCFLIPLPWQRSLWLFLYKGRHQVGYRPFLSRIGLHSPFLFTADFPYHSLFTMTEYDYSPEAYQRYLNTQQRIGRWVDKTEGCRTQFANPFNPPASHMPGFEEPPSASRHSSRKRSSHNQSRSPSPGSGDEALYGRGPYAPGPMLPMRSAPGHLSNFPKHQLPFQRDSPLPSPPIVSPQGSMPPSYYGTPSIQQVKAHRRSQPRHFAPPPPLMLSPPVSPGVYGQQSPGYVMVSPGPMPIMYVRPC